MQADRFPPLLSAKGPYASVYFDDSHDTEDAAAQLDITLRDLRSQLDEQGADAGVSDRFERGQRVEPTRREERKSHCPWQRGGGAR